MFHSVAVFLVIAITNIYCVLTMCQGALPPLILTITPFYWRRNRGTEKITIAQGHTAYKRGL